MTPVADGILAGRQSATGVTSHKGKKQSTYCDATPRHCWTSQQWHPTCSGQRPEILPAQGNALERRSTRVLGYFISFGPTRQPFDPQSVGPLARQHSRVRRLSRAIPWAGTTRPLRDDLPCSRFRGERIKPWAPAQVVAHIYSQRCDRASRARRGGTCAQPLRQMPSKRPMSPSNEL